MSRQRILVIEEDGNRGDVIANHLDRDGHETIIARDREDGVRQARELLPDRIILDMPIADCLEICWRLGDIDGTREIPVSMLAQDAAAVSTMSPAFALGHESLVNLNGGNDNVLHLTALRSGRPPVAHQTQVLEYRGVRIDLLQHQAYSNGAKLALTPTEFRLLECFLRQPGRAFTRAQLMDFATSKGNGVLERTIDCHVKSLRRKLNSNRVVIQTVRGIGYRFRDPRD